MRAWCVVAALLLLATSAQASQMTIYFTDESAPAAGGGVNCAAQRGWLLSQEAPASAGKAYMSMTSPGLGCATTFAFTAEEAFVTEGPFVVAVKYDCDTPTIVGSSPATSGTRFTLLHNGDTVGEVTNTVFAPCTGPIADGASLGAAGRTVEAGDTLSLRILWWGGDVVPQVPSLHVVTGPDGPSTMTVDYSLAAAPAPEASTIQEDLAGAAVEHAFANATSDTYVLNFTTDLVNSTATFSWNATAGSVNATLMDANGTVVYNGTFEGNGTLSHHITDAAAGPWNLTLAYNGFNGTISFDLAPPSDAGGGNTTGDDAVQGADGADGNNTQGLDGAGKDSPLPLLVPLVAFAAAAVRRRW